MNNANKFTAAELTAAIGAISLPASRTSELRVVSTRLILAPHADVVSQSPELAAVYSLRVEDSAANTAHSVSLVFTVVPDKSRDEPSFLVQCSDKFLEGRYRSEDEARKMCEQVAEGLGNPRGLAAKMMEAYKVLDASGQCSFWMDLRRDGKLCDHTLYALAHLRNAQPNYQQELADLYNSVKAAPVKPVGDTMELEELAFRVPVLIEGDRGAGKTYTSRAFARENGYLRIEMPGHEGVEAPDMLGFLVPVEAGKMVWKDGPVAQAFRAAKAQKVVLIIDEMLRIRQRELSILLTALSPDEGVYRIRTGRITAVTDDVAVEEELECPVENLCIVATTNVGSGYAVDDIDPALAERFVILRSDTLASKLRAVLETVVKAQGLPVSLVKKLVDFFTKMTEARVRGLVQHAPTTRTMVRSVELAASEADVVRSLRTMSLLWVARDAEGHPVTEQVENVEQLIKRIFSSK